MESPQASLDNMGVPKGLLYSPQNRNEPLRGSWIDLTRVEIPVEFSWVVSKPMKKKVLLFFRGPPNVNPACVLVSPGFGSPAKAFVKHRHRCHRLADGGCLEKSAWLNWLTGFNVGDSVTLCPMD